MFPRHGHLAVPSLSWETGAGGPPAGACTTNAQPRKGSGSVTGLAVVIRRFSYGPVKAWEPRTTAGNNSLGMRPRPGPPRFYRRAAPPRATYLKRQETPWGPVTGRRNDAQIT